MSGIIGNIRGSVLSKKNQESTKKIRIGVDARPLSTPVSGVGKLIESVLMGFDSDEEFEFILFSHREFHEGYKHILEYPNIQMRLGTGLLARKGGLYFGLALPLQLRNSGIDLFWGTQQVFPPFLPENIPGVLTYHDLVAYRFPDTMRPIARLQQLFYLRRSILRADLVLANSEFTAKELRKYYDYPSEKIRIVYPGYEPKEIRVVSKAPTLRTSAIPKRFFLTVSTLEPRKNFSTLFTAYSSLKKKNPKYPLIWVHAGKEGWESPEFLTEFKAASKKGDLVWVDSPDRSELQYLYSKAELFIFPSIYEGFGIPLLEALAYSIPCIVSDLEVFREIAGNSCVYVEPDSTRAWEEELLAFTRKKKAFKKPNLKKFERRLSARKAKEAFLDLARPK